LTNITAGGHDDTANSFWEATDFDEHNCRRACPQTDSKFCKMKLPAETGQETKPGTLMNVRAKLVPAKENEEPETARRQDIRRKPEEG